MFAITINEKGGEARRLEFDKLEVTIGRVAGNDIILPKGNVSKRHSRIVFKDGKFIIVDLKSTNGTYVNGRKITSPMVIKSSDKVYVGDFILSVEDPGGAAEASAMDDATAPPLPPPTRRPTTAPPAPPAPPPLRRPTAAPPPASEEDDFEPPVGDLANQEFGTQPPTNQPFPTAFDNSAPGEGADPLDDLPDLRAPRPTTPPLRPAAPGRPTMPPPAAARTSAMDVVNDEPPPVEAPPRRAAEPLARPTPPSRPSQPAPAAYARDRAPTPVAQPKVEIAKAVNPEILRLLVSRMEPRVTDATGIVEGEGIAHDLIDALASRELAPQTDRDALARAVASEVLGWGPLDLFLEDPRVRQIMVARYDRIFVDRDGQLALTGQSFSSAEMMARVIERMTAKLEVCSNQAGLVEARLADGTLLLAAVPPLAGPSPTVFLRRPRKDPVLLADLVNQKVLSSAMAEVLEMAVLARCNIVVGGAPGSGRSTLLAALANAAAPEERVVVVEAHEPMTLRQDAAIQLSAGADSVGAIRLAMRLGAQRLVIDDLCSGAARVALEAAAALPGTELSLTANSAYDAVARLEAMALLAGGAIDARALREAIAQSIQIVIQLDARADGRFHIEQFAEVASIDAEGRLGLNEVFKFQPDGGEGRFAATGHVPAFAAAASPSLFRL